MIYGKYEARGRHRGQHMADMCGLSKCAISNGLNEALSFSQLKHERTVTIRWLNAMTPLFISHLSRLFSCIEVYWMANSTGPSCAVFNESSWIVQCSIHVTVPGLFLRFQQLTFFFFYNCNFCLGSDLIKVICPLEGTSIDLVWAYFIVFQRIQKA